MKTMNRNADNTHVCEISFCHTQRAHIALLAQVCALLPWEAIQRVFVSDRDRGAWSDFEQKALPPLLFPGPPWPRTARSTPESRPAWRRRLSPPAPASAASQTTCLSPRPSWEARISTSTRTTQRGGRPRMFGMTRPPPGRTRGSLARHQRHEAHARHGLLHAVAEVSLTMRWRPVRSGGKTIAAPCSSWSKSGRGGLSRAAAVTEIRPNGARSGAPCCRRRRPRRRWRSRARAAPARLTPRLVALDGDHLAAEPRQDGRRVADPVPTSSTRSRSRQAEQLRHVGHDPRLRHGLPLADPDRSVAVGAPALVLGGTARAAPPPSPPARARRGCRAAAAGARPCAPVTGCSSGVATGQRTVTFPRPSVTIPARSRVARKRLQLARGAQMGDLGSASSGSARRRRARRRPGG